MMVVDVRVKLRGRSLAVLQAANSRNGTPDQRFSLS
jgi:hypothetical protein